MRKLMLLSACLVACAALAVADDKKDDKTKSEPTVSVTMLSVNHKLDQKLFSFSSDSTSLSLLLRYPGKQLLGVDQSSEVKSLKDDKGNSLIDDKGFFKVNFGTYPTIAKDRSAMVVYLSSFNKAPGKGATKVLLKGDLMVLCGTDEKSEEVKKFEFKDKGEGKAGDFKLKVTQEKGFGNQGASFTLISPTKDVKGLVVKDADGKEVEVYAGMPFSSAPKEFSIAYTLQKPVKEGTVTITYFTKSEKVKVPVDLSVGIDLGG
jgi:hypothetical protein